jgi:hypothetical protein
MKKIARIAESKTEGLLLLSAGAMLLFITLIFTR